MVTTAAKPDWYADPTERHRLRYWDGARWTANVSDQGDASLDELAPEPPPPVRPAGQMTVTPVGTIKPAGPVVIDAVNGRLAICCFGVLGIGGGYRVYALDPFAQVKHPDFGTGECRQLVFDRAGHRLAAAEFSFPHLCQGWVHDHASGRHSGFAISTSAQHYMFSNAMHQGSDSVALSPSGRLLAFSGPEALPLVGVVDELVAGGEFYAHLFPLPSITTGVVRRPLVWSPDGRTLASATHDASGAASVDLWSFPNGEDSQMVAVTVRSAATPDSGTAVTGGRVALQFSPDSQWLALGGGSAGTGAIEIFEVQSMTPVSRSAALPATVRALDFAPNGAFLVSGDASGNVVVWTLRADGIPALTPTAAAQVPGRVLALGWTQTSDGVFVAYERRPQKLIVGGEFGMGGEVGISFARLDIATP